MPLVKAGKERLTQQGTNRNQEPSPRVHAAMAMAMAKFRVGAEKLVHAIGDNGRHGNFEAAAVAREAVMAFSTRWQQVPDARRGNCPIARIFRT